MNTRLLMACLATLLIGIGAGYLHGRPDRSPWAPVGAAEVAFRARVEAYAPTCGQLRAPGRHGPLTQGTTLLYVRTQDDYFYVVGIETPADGPPMTYWWGAGRADALRQACGR